METQINAFDNTNLLAAYGLRPTPPPGTTIRKIEIRDEDHNGYFDRIKDRYIWYPLSDINFVGKMITQPMSQEYFYRGRIGWIQPVAYKGLDNSPEAFDREEDEELPLKTFLLTPFAQCVYAHLNYADRGLRVFEHLKNQPPEVVTFIENLLMPEVPPNLIDLGKYLVSISQKNVEEAQLDPKTRELALETLASMIEGVNQAVKYCQVLIAETENEILMRRNKGVGKSHLDNNDKFAYVMTKKRIPEAETLEDRNENAGNELLERLVRAVEGKAAPRVEAEDEEKAVLRSQLSALEQRFEALLDRLPSVTTSAPAIDDTETVEDEVAQVDLKTRLNRKRK